MYFERCTGASVGAGVEGSGVGESEGVVDGEGESSRERLGIACAKVAVRRLLWLLRAQRITPYDATSSPPKGLDKSWERFPFVWKRWLIISVCFLAHELPKNNART